MTNPNQIKDPLNMSAINAQVSLMADAMYLNGADHALEQAAKANGAIGKAARKVERLNHKLKHISERNNGDNQNTYDDVEPIAIQLEAAEHDLGVAHAPVLRAYAMVHVLAAASLEAHINERALNRLSGKHFELFERFSLEAKWVTLPKLLDLPGFDVGAEPFQSFSQMVKLRNALVHYKTKREDWIPPGVPAFLRKLGLTQSEGEKSIRTAKRMIRELSNQLGESEPIWLRRKGGFNYFEVNFR